MLDADLISEAFNRTGSIRGAASDLGFDERTLRRWAAEDDCIRRVLYPNAVEESSEASGMKILALDIETRPNVALVWDLWSKSPVPPQAVTEATEMLCWAAKWIGDSTIVFRSTFANTKKDMVQTMWDLLNEADAVVHYNGARFDIPYLNMEFVRQGLGPPSPYKQIDLYKFVKKNFSFPSKKLVYVSREFGLSGKIEHEGFPLWIKCINGDPDAWARMEEYNVRDTELLEDLYFKLRPWGSNMPSHGAMTGEDVCPACGSTDLKRRGWEYTKTGKYQRYQCGDCGKWSRAVKRSSGTGVTEA